MLIDMFTLFTKTTFSLIILILLSRFYLYMIHASYKHPLTKVSVKLTAFIVNPIKKLIPSTKNYESATLVLAIIFAMLNILIVLLISHIPYDFYSPKSWLMILFLSILEIAKYSVDLLIIATIAQSILSWLQPYNILTPLLQQLTKPFLQPFRWAKIRNIDLSPVLLFIFLQFIIYILILSVENYFASQIHIII